MSRVEELEGQIKELSSQELSELRVWMAEYDATTWDDQFDADVAAGRLDALATQALRHHAERRTTPL